jgi:CheY-like chemotaxis protein
VGARPGIVAGGAFGGGKGGAYAPLIRRGGYCRGREDDGRRRLRVLVAEDERLMGDAIAVGLRRRAMAVDVCYDGAAALERVLVHRYDVVILDRDLPAVHGDEVCRQIVAAGAETRVLMLTAAQTVRQLGPQNLGQRIAMGGGAGDLAAEHGVALHRSLAERLVPGDQVLLERLLANLVANAIKYNQPGGWVEVEVTSPPGAAVIVSNTRPARPGRPGARAVRAVPPARRRPDRPRRRRRPGPVHRPLDHRRARRHGLGPSPARRRPDRGDQPAARILRHRARQVALAATTTSIAVAQTVPSPAAGPSSLTSARSTL